MEINWNEFKIFKKGRPKNEENFSILIAFLQSYYKIVSVREIYEALREDELAKMMLDKKEIRDLLDMEEFLFNMKK